MSTITCAKAKSLVLQQIGNANEIAVARAHLLECPQCASDTADDIDQVSRTLSNLRNPGGVRRAMLLIVSAIQIALALPWMFGATLLWGQHLDPDVSHLTRDGAIGLILGVIGIAVASKPRLAYFALTMCGLLAILQIAAFVSDRAEGHVHSNFEVIHLLSAVVSVLVLSMVHRPASAK